MKKIAIVDLGSNSIHMNIMRINEHGGYSVFDSAKETVRLSEGLQQDGILKKDPMDRAIKALRYFKRLAEVAEVVEIHVIATAAVRMAKNKEIFIGRVKEEVGFELKIVSGRSEAYYDYLAVVNSIEVEDCVIIDIGGASTEIVLVINRKLEESVSLPFGSVTLTEKFSGTESKKNRVKAACKHVRNQMDAIPWKSRLKGLRIIGLGGTIRAIGKIDRSFNKYPIKNMHNYRMVHSELERVFSLVFKKEDEELRYVEGLESRRAEVIALGMVPLRVLVGYTGAMGISISGQGLRDGFFYESFFKASGEPIVVDDVLRHSCDNTMKRFNVNPVHSEQVKFISLRLFDLFKDFHSFDSNDRKVLEIASVFHDAGMHIEYYDHHIHGMYLLIYGKINGLTNHEHLKVAFLVGNHRESSVKAKMKEYSTLFSKKDIKSILKLSIFLKMAEQLDRSLNSLIKDIKIRIEGRKAVIEIYGDEEPLLEIEAANKYRGLFYKSFSLSYEIQYMGGMKQAK
ncbi:MAG: hypothetical protein C0604_06185 [Clostridiales bacterium]|nr:MAG: hypothetical protein C0604_06185 [Clostridiales bacterium]